ncbi:MAG: DUF4268 domain-containing protein [Flavobacteriaceae bacterium]|nr:DUF4268 domain-containing protein [Flavobacteriaceae bacterium]
MFSKEESRALRELFWTSFGKSFPKKWLLYKTGIKGVAFKFYFDTKKAIVSLDIEGGLEHRITYFERLESLKNILIRDYNPEIIYEDCFILPNGKEISRIYVEQDQLCIHNKNTWQDAMLFLKEQMEKMEDFFDTYKEVIHPE